MARVVSVYKTGDKHKVQNYGPISITCACCKIFEHILSKPCLVTSKAHKGLFLTSMDLGATCPQPPN